MPLVDVLLAVVVFELSLFSAPDCACIPPRAQPPSAVHVGDLEEAPVVVLDGRRAAVDGVPTDDVAATLRAKRELWQALEPERAFPGRVTLFVDRAVPAGRVKAALAAAGAAGYPYAGFTVRRAAGAATPPARTESDR